MRIRSATADDLVFMTSMLLAAADWSEAHELTAAGPLADPRIRAYIADWPRPDDRGLIAVDEAGTSLGACWLRYRPSSNPGFGFLAADVPELTIGVRADARRAGVGRALLRAVAGQAQAEGLTRLSLSVEHGNPAADLYRSEGWRVVVPEVDADTMVLDLGPDRRTG
jgi:GNAT superfamily N-acetyltransferase